MIAAPYVRRTRRVGEIVGLLGHSTGGRPGERLMQRLGMPVSDDTILRQLKHDAAGAQRNSEIRVIGIDDWSWRRATSYGTIMVDLERRSVIDILDDRSVESAAKWLRCHPSIESSAGTAAACMRRPSVKAHPRPSRSPIGFI